MQQGSERACCARARLYTSGWEQDAQEVLGSMRDAGLCTEEAFPRIIACWDVLLGRAPPQDGSEPYAGAHELAGGGDAPDWEEDGSSALRWDEWDEGADAGSVKLEYER